MGRGHDRRRTRRGMMRRLENTRVPRPRRGVHIGALPHALTFFLTSEQRTRVLRLLNARGPSRASALLRLLNQAHRAKNGGAR